MNCLVVALLIPSAPLQEPAQNEPPASQSRYEGRFQGVDFGWFSVNGLWMNYDSDLGLENGPGVEISIFAALDSLIPSRDKWRKPSKEGEGPWFEWGMEFDLRYFYSEDRRTDRSQEVGILSFGYAGELLFGEELGIGGLIAVGSAHFHGDDAETGLCFRVSLPRVNVNLGSGLSVGVAPEWEWIHTGFNADHYRSTYSASVAFSLTYRF